MALYELMSWMSPAFPVGAFSHSGGLEWVVEAGLVTDRISTEAWLEDSLSIGAAWNDCVAFVYAHRAAIAADFESFLEIADLALASLTSFERRLESTAQGEAFLRIAKVSAACDALEVLKPIRQGELAYPIAVACVAAGHKISLTDALIAYLHGTISNQISAAQRLVPLGQTDAQLAIAALRETVQSTAAEAASLQGDPVNHLRGGAFMADIACMAHETQYTRLFRT
ncbi:MAG: urease accessory protein UreF [Caulobacterales bacterium]